jgi:predicted CopG family antitoxin
MKSATRTEVYNTRMTVKKECESISEFVAQLMVSVDKVSKACEETREFTESAFGDLNSQAE